jgi:hypothetical protein
MEAREAELNTHISSYALIMEVKEKPRHYREQI